MKSSEEQKILGLITDNKLTLKSHAKKLCKKASQKIWKTIKVPKWLAKELNIQISNKVSI